ncbi:MAG: hypothetical protein DSZ30_04720 [Aquificaceae bacterium]|nr:MAG: hypothetical protein DSZ30_04720 [Aquificaceae bacterium]
MAKKFLLLILVSLELGFSTTLSELLNTVQDLVTDYETSGKAIRYPYLYTKISQYYRYGKLYTAYGLEKSAINLLELASCSATPIDCSPYKYFTRNLHPKSFSQLFKKNPVLTAKVETSYNAYAEWWINKKFSNDETYHSYKNLENILKKDFLDAWAEFLRTADKPIHFQVSKSLKPADLFLLDILYNSYRLGFIKKITFYGDKGDYMRLLHEGLIPYTVQYQPYNCTNYDFLVVY